MSTATFVDIIIAILLPPLGVFLRFGCGVYLSIFLLITRLCFILINLIDIFYIYSQKEKLKVEIMNFVAGWVLDMFGFDAAWVYSWDHIRYLYPHQMIYHLSPVTLSSSPCKLSFYSTLCLIPYMYSCDGHGTRFKKSHRLI